MLTLAVTFMIKTTAYSAASLIPLAGVDATRWNKAPTEIEITSTAKALGDRGIKVVRVDEGSRALKALREIIPMGATVMNGSSTTLVEIGYDDLMRDGQHGWVDLHKAILAENDAQKRADLRRQSLFADYFISGCNAISQSGEIVACDATGSRVGAWHFSSKKLILVSGVNKIVPNLEAALSRVRDFVFPLENQRVGKVSGNRSHMNKWVILAGEPVAGRTTLILIDKILGY